MIPRVMMAEIIADAIICDTQVRGFDVARIREIIGADALTSREAIVQAVLERILS